MKNNYGWLGEGPQRRWRGKGGAWETRPTEFHEALSSFGRRDRTRHLSDGEFCSQVGQEIGYFVGEGNHHLARGARGICRVIAALFS